MKKYLLSLTLSLLCIPIVLWGQNTSAKRLSSRLDTLIKYQLPAGSNVGISVYDLTTVSYTHLDVYKRQVYIYIVKRTVDQAFAQFRVFVLAGTDGGDYYNQAIQ